MNIFTHGQHWIAAAALLGATTAVPAAASPSIRAEFDRLDVDADAELSRQEAQAVPGLPEVYELSDIDGDDGLSFGEFVIALCGPTGCEEPPPSS